MTLEKSEALRAQLTEARDGLVEALQEIRRRCAVLRVVEINDDGSNWVLTVFIDEVIEKFGGCE